MGEPETCQHLWSSSKLVCSHCGALGRWKGNRVVAFSCNGCGKVATAFVETAHGKWWCEHCAIEARKGRHRP